MWELKSEITLRKFDESIACNKLRKVRVWLGLSCDKWKVNENKTIWSPGRPDWMWEFKSESENQTTWSH